MIDKCVSSRFHEFTDELAEREKNTFMPRSQTSTALSGDGQPVTWEMRDMQGTITPDSTCLDSRGESSLERNSGIRTSWLWDWIFLAKRKIWDVILLTEASSVSYSLAFNWLSWHLSRGHRFFQGIILNTCQEELPRTQSHVGHRFLSEDSWAVSADPYEANFKTCKYWY